MVAGPVALKFNITFFLQSFYKHRAAEVRDLQRSREHTNCPGATRD